MSDTIIGSSIVVDGEITSEEILVVEGTVKGTVSAKQALRVAAGGVVEAEVASASVEIAGRLSGTVVASEKVELRPDCRVVGSLKSPRILIADGASFKGNVDMDVER